MAETMTPRYTDAALAPHQTPGVLGPHIIFAAPTPLHDSPFCTVSTEHFAGTSRDCHGWRNNDDTIWVTLAHILQVRFLEHFLILETSPFFKVHGPQGLL